MPSSLLAIQYSSRLIFYAQRIEHLLTQKAGRDRGVVDSEKLVLGVAPRRGGGGGAFPAPSYGQGSPCRSKGSYRAGVYLLRPLGSPPFNLFAFKIDCTIAELLLLPDL